VFIYLVPSQVCTTSVEASFKLTEGVVFVDCQVLDLLDRIYVHFQNDHDSHPNMILAPQAFPFIPTPDPTPMPPLPHGLVPTYMLSPLIITPGRRTKPPKAPDPASAPSPTNTEHHLTFWSCFEYREHMDVQDERSMRRNDIDFEPLRHPVSLSDKDPWPEFAVSAEQAEVPQKNLVSAPLMPTSISPPPPSRVNRAASQTFLYHAFKKYLEEKPL
jgi:hypothetical protein